MRSSGALIHLVNGCNSFRTLKQIHAHLLKVQFLLDSSCRVFVINRLLFLCAFSRFSSLTYAARLFKSIDKPDINAYNIMIRAFASSKHDEDDDGGVYRSPLALYKRMLSEGISPDHLTFPFLFKECTNARYTPRGRIVHCQVLKFGFDADVFVCNMMIAMYSTGRDNVECARKVFEAMPHKDVISWNSMIFGLLRAGDLDSASDLFDGMEGRNVITWNSILTGFIRAGKPNEALQLFYRMQCEGVEPDKITIATILTACACLGALDHGERVHGLLRRNMIECDTVINTALIDMYGKCGSVDRAVEIFRSMPVRDNLAWTAMISVFALHGRCDDAFRYFEEMLACGVKVNGVTFVGLLSACAHSGSIERGRWCFDAMRCVYGIEQEVQHYACMVDILSRVGQLEEAQGLIGRMPMEPDTFVWGALLGGCLVHGDVDMGERVAKRLIEMEPMNHVFYQNLCDLYRKADRVRDVKRVRGMMKERGLEKDERGCSMMEIDGIVHEYSVQGSGQCSMITGELSRVLNCLFVHSR